MNNKNTDALQQIEAIKQQISDSQKQLQQLEDSLKEPEWRVNDWIMREEDSYKNGPYQIDSMEGPDGRDTDGNYRELSSGRYRHCTEAEIQEATKPKVGDKYIVTQECSEKGTIVTVKELETKPGQYHTFQDAEEDNWWNIPDQVRKATPEEIKQHRATQVKILTIGSDQREVMISKGKIVAADSDVKIEDIDRIAGIMKGTKGFGGWAVTFREVKIGCFKSIQYSELKAIQEAYQKLNQ